MKTRRIIAACAALLAMTMCLSACGQNNTGSTPAVTTAAAETTTSEAQTEAAEPETSAAETLSDDNSSAETAYTVIVLDEAGDPVEGAAAQFCSNEQCLFEKTGADGKVSFAEPEGKYTVHMLKVPEGFEKDSTEYQVPETYGTITITLKAAGDDTSDNVQLDSNSWASPEVGVTYNPGSEFDGIKGTFDATGLFIDNDSNPRIGVFMVTYYACAPEDFQEYQDYYHECVQAMGTGEAMPEAPHEGWENFMAVQAPVTQVLVVDGDAEFTSLSFDPTFDISTLKLLAEDGKTKFYLYPQSSQDAMQDTFRQGMASFYDEFNSLREKEDEIVSHMTFSEAERPKDDGRVMPEKLEFEGYDLDGNAVNSADLFAGHKVTMVNLWATWCGPCKAELAELGNLAKEFEEKDCQMIGICADAEDPDTIDAAKLLLKNAECDYTNICGWDTLLEEIPTTGFPTTIFVDSEGKIIGQRITGANVDAYPKAVDDLLASME